MIAVRTTRVLVLQQARLSCACCKRLPIDSVTYALNCKVIHFSSGRMYMNLINDILIRAGVITDISNGGIQTVIWFKDITFTNLVFMYVLPLAFFLGLALYLKIRYNKKRERDEITLRPFLKLNPPMAPV